jgi:hypothetical protein
VSRSRVATARVRKEGEPVGRRTGAVNPSTSETTTLTDPIAVPADFESCGIRPALVSGAHNVTKFADLQSEAERVASFRHPSIISRIRSSQ